MRLNTLAFAFTCSLLWGFGVFLLAWWIMAFDGRGVDAGILGHIYRGFAITPMGSVIGLLYALVDGFVGGWLFAWLYNVLNAYFDKGKGGSAP